MKSLVILTVMTIVIGVFFLQTDEGRKGQQKETPQRIVAIRGEPFSLVGPELQVGENAPEFTAVDKNYKPVRLADFSGKTVMISVVFSLDTAVCSRQTQRFNEEAAKLPENVVLITMSMDLPFAQKRFCESEKVDRILVLSDIVDREFGRKYGVLIKERGLLARSIFIIGKAGRIVYKEIVPELSKEPDYEAALRILKSAAR